MRVAGEETHGGEELHRLGLVGGDDGHLHRPRPRLVFRRGERDRRVSVRAHEGVLVQGLRVEPDRELELETVAGLVARALDRHAHGHAVPGREALGRREVEVDPLGLFFLPLKLPGVAGRIALELQALDLHRRGARPARAFHDAPDAAGGELVSRPHEAGEGRLDDDRQADGDDRARRAEFVVVGGGDAAHAEVGEVVRQVDRDFGQAVLHRNGGIDVGHGLEIAAHGGLREELLGRLVAGGRLASHFARLPAAAGDLLHRQVAHHLVPGLVEAQGRGDRVDEGGERAQGPLLAERQDGPVHQPERGRAVDRRAPPVLHDDFHLQFFAGEARLLVLERHFQLVAHRIDLHPGGGGHGDGAAAVDPVAGREARGGPGAGEAAPEEQHVDGHAGDHVLVDGEGEEPLAAAHVGPVVLVPVRALDHDEGVRVLEGRFQKQGGPVPRRVAFLVERGFEDVGVRLLPAHRLFSGEVEVGLHRLQAAERVLGERLHHVDAGPARVEVEGERLRGRPVAFLENLFVDHVGVVFDLAGGEVGLAQVRVPLAAVEPHGERLARERFFVEADDDHPRRNRFRVLDEAVHLEADGEGGHGHDPLDRCHGLPVGALDRGFHHVGAGRARVLRGRVQRQAGGAFGVGDRVNDARPPGLVVPSAGEGLVGGKRKARQAGRAHGIREPGDLPGHFLPRHPAARVIVGGEDDLELAVEGHAVRSRERDLEGGHAVGFLLERDAREGASLFHVDNGGGVVAGGNVLPVELDGDSLVRTEGDVIGPPLPARARDVELALAGGVGGPDHALPAETHVAHDVHRFLGPVERALGEQVGAAARPSARDHGIGVQEGEPARSPVRPVIVPVDGRGIGRVEDDLVVARRHNDAPHGLFDIFPVDVAEEAPGVGRPGDHRHPIAGPAPAALAFHRDPGARHGPPGLERGDDEDDLVLLFERGQGEVGHDEADVHAAAARSEQAAADQVGAGRVFSGDALEDRAEVEPEAARAGRFPDGQVDDARVVRRAEEPDLLPQVLPVGGLLAGHGRAGILVHRHGRGGEGPEVAVFRIDFIHAQVGAREAAAFHGEELGAVALDHGLAAFPLQVGVELAVVEIERRRAEGREPAARRALEGEVGELELVRRILVRAEGEDEPVALDREAEVPDGGLEAHEALHRLRAERGECFAEAQGHRAPAVPAVDRLIERVDASVGGHGQVGVAGGHADEPELRFGGEGVGGERARELLVEGKAQGEGEELPVGHRRFELEPVPVGGAGVGLVQELDGEVVCGEPDGRAFAHAGEGLDLERDHGGEVGGRDLVREGEDERRDRIEVAGAGRRGKRRRRHHQGEEGAARAARLDREVFEGGPGHGRQKLDGPGVDEAVLARYGRAYGEQVAGIVERAAAGRADRAGVEHRDRVVAAQKRLGDDDHALGAQGLLEARAHGTALPALLGRPLGEESRNGREQQGGQYGGDRWFFHYSPSSGFSVCP